MGVHPLPPTYRGQVTPCLLSDVLAFITGSWSLAIHWFSAQHHFVAVVDPYNRQCQLITSVRSMQVDASTLLCGDHQHDFTPLYTVPQHCFGPVGS